MNYQFVRITNYYPQYLQKYYAANPDITSRTYAEQYRHLINDSLESASSYSKALNTLDGIKAQDIISNAVYLNEAWDKEHPENSAMDRVIGQLKVIQPDVIWIDDFSIISEKWKAQLLSEVPSVKLILGHICAPYNEEIEEKFKLFDLMFSCIPCIVEELKVKGINAHLLYHSFDEEILKRIGSGQSFPPTKFLFSGSLYAGAGFHNTRMEYIESFIKNDLPISLYTNLETTSSIRKKRLFYYFYQSLKKTGLLSVANMFSFFRKKKAYGEVPVPSYSAALRAAAHPPVFGINLFRLMSQADITFNNHGEIAGKCAGNIRMFEVTGVGSCLVTDWKENITDLFIPDKEIVTYRSKEECIEKVKWLLEHPEERKKIAKAGQERTLRSHTVMLRAKQLDAIIRKELNNLSLTKSVTHA